MKHTPGPWEIKEHPDFLGEYILVNERPNNTIGEYLDENRANAKLIQAAPDLLTACNLLLPIASCDNCENNGMDYCCNNQCNITIAKEAIAKATGETP